jgi:phosphatidate cytidylyltransferase
MLKTRLITASILIFGVLASIFLASDFIWSVLSLMVILLGIWEWSRLIKLNEKQSLANLVIGFALGLFVLCAFNATYDQFREQFILLLLASASFIWIVFVPIYLSIQSNATKSNFTNNKMLMFLVGLILLPATLIALIGLHHISPWLLLGVIATVSIADSAAYFAGKCFGKHKLAPTISPGKTWEGVAGAFVAVTIYGALLCAFLGYSVWLIAGLWGMVVLSIMGDLFESKLKRMADIKDSGQLLPGHGGILDRIDGLMPTVVLTLFYIYLPLFFSNSLHV